MQTIKQPTKARQNGNAVQYNIGGAAKASGVSAKMIRHYESIGLIPKAGRSLGNYRTYTGNDVHTLRFIQRARALGFSIKQIATLVSLWRNRSRSSANVRRLALEHVGELQAKIVAMQTMVRTLDDLARSCRGDARPDCPILDDLARPQVRAVPKQEKRS